MWHCKKTTFFQATSHSFTKRLLKDPKIFLFVIYTFCTLFDYCGAPNLPAQEIFANYKVEDET
jgi:hypothetical protein